MALLNEGKIMGIIVMIAIVFISFFSFSSDISSNSNIKLSTESYEYIGSFGKFLLDQKIIELSEEDIATMQNENVLGNEGTQSVTDVLASLNYYKSKVTGVIGYFKLLYNVPTLLLMSFNLSDGSFSTAINIIGIFISVTILVVVIRLIRGS